MAGEEGNVGARPATPQTDAGTESDRIPTVKEDQERIAADEKRLEEVEADIEAARAIHRDQKRRYQSGLLPQAEGDEGEGDASKLRG